MLKNTQHSVRQWTPNIWKPGPPCSTGPKPGTRANINTKQINKRWLHFEMIWETHQIIIRRTFLKLLRFPPDLGRDPPDQTQVTGPRSNQGRTAQNIFSHRKSDDQHFNPKNVDQWKHDLSKNDLTAKHKQEGRFPTCENSFTYENIWQKPTMATAVSETSLRKAWNLFCENFVLS